MSALLLPPFWQATNSSGAIVSGAKLYVYTAGTTTDKTVYTDNALSAAHAQPVVADSAGRFANIYASPGLYKLVLKTSADAEIATHDNFAPYIASDGGTLPVTGGGTGATAAANARSNLAAASSTELATLSSTVSSIANGQTQATWDAGTGTAVSVISPANLRSAIFQAGSQQPDALIVHKTASAVHAGGITAGSWNTRPLTDVLYDDDSLVSLLNNQFTATKAGIVKWRAPAFSCGVHHSRLINASTSATIASGTAEHANQGSSVQTSSYGWARIDADIAYQLEHRPEASTGSYGMGHAGGFGEENYYAVIEYYRLEA